MTQPYFVVGVKVNKPLVSPLFLSEGPSRLSLESAPKAVKKAVRFVRGQSDVAIVVFGREPSASKAPTSKGGESRRSRFEGGSSPRSF
jgi:hypothetical protein